MRNFLVLGICLLVLSACSSTPAVTVSVSPSIPTEEKTQPGRRVITAENASEVQLIKTLEIPGYVRGKISQCNTTFNPDGSLLLGVCGKNPVAVWDVTAETLKYTLYPADQQIVTCAFSPDGRTITCGGFDNKVTFWDAKTGTMEKEFAAISSAVWDIAFSPDGATLATCGIGDKVRLWDIASGEQLWESDAVDACLSLSFDPTGKTLAYGGRYGSVGVLDATTGVEIVKLITSGTPVGDIAFSHDGIVLAAASDDSLVHLWQVTDPTTGEGYSSIDELTGHNDYVNGVAFSPDDSLLLTGSHDTSVRIWNAKTLQSIKVLVGHEGVVLRGCFDPTGTLIATISWDGTVKLWGIDQ